MAADEDQSLTDMLAELRILLQGSQLLSGFLTVLPFSEGFAKIDRAERWVYFATFAAALLSLVLFSAPAAHHRIARPITDRARFKDYCTRMILGGLAFLSLALVLATQLVVNEVLGLAASLAAAAVTATVVAVVWWILPLTRRHLPSG